MVSWSNDLTFVNTDTSPETVDFNGAIGTGTTRTVQVRYTQPINAQQKILVALEGGDVEKLVMLPVEAVFLL